MNLFQESHLYQILPCWENTSLPLDVFLRKYFLQHRSLGSKDRKILSEAIYSMVRWQDLLDAFFLKTPSWQQRWSLWQKNPFQNRAYSSFPLSIQLGFPPFLFSLLEKTYGIEQAKSLCETLNSQAPLTIRVNPRKISRDAFFHTLKHSYAVQKCLYSPYGIHFAQRVPVSTWKEFHQGWFEIQDESSQRAALFVEAKPNESLLDFCAGSGGKSLVFSTSMKDRGLLLLYDIRSSCLLQAQKRLYRSSAKQFRLCSDSDLISWKNKVDTVVVDAPCSGSGTLRRNPDRKKSITPSFLQQQIPLQKNLFKEALTYVRPQGKIVYLTCSILSQENEEQVQSFLESFPIKLLQPPQKWLPEMQGGDGFFAAAFQKS